MADFNELLNLAKQNKRKRIHENKELTYCILNSDETYPAVIVDAEYNNKEDNSFIVLKLVVVKDSLQIERTFTFKFYNGSFGPYDSICETLGTSGSPSDLIGKCVYMHIERNGDYQNLRVDAEMEKSEFEEMISDMNNKNVRPKKKASSNNTPYVPPSSFKDEMANEEDDFEEEFLEDEE